MTRTSLSMTFVAATLALASIASAAPTVWDMPAGDQGSYTYSNGQSTNGNFGTGNTFSNGFYFLPASLRAVALGTGQTDGPVPEISTNGHDEASDTVSVILNAKPNQMFSHIGSSFLGDYSIFGEGSVDSTGTLRVINLDTSITLTAPLAFGGTVPVSTVDDAEGPFNGTAGIDLPAGWSNIRVELDGFVSADATTGSSLIQVKDAEISVQTQEIPLPAAALVAPVAAFMGWRARRKLGLVR